MKKVSMFMLSICLMINSIVSHADDCLDSCNVVLAEGVFDREEISTRKDSSSNFLDFMCTSAYSLKKKEIENQLCDSSSNKSSEQYSGEGNYLELASGSADANVQKEFQRSHCESRKNFKYDEWSKEYCHNKQSIKSDKLVEHKLRQQANPILLDKWLGCKKECTKRFEMVCHAREHGDFVSFSIEWAHKYAGTLKEVQFTLGNLSNESVLPKIIREGTSELMFKRIEKSRREESVITVSAIETVTKETEDGEPIKEKQDVSCKYFVPAASCKKPLYKEGQGKVCGLKGYGKSARPSCKPIKWETKADPSCGIVYLNKRHPDCNSDRIPVSIDDGGCSACGGHCERLGGGISGCTERREGTFHRRHPCNGTCVVNKICRTQANGIERYEECSKPHFKAIAWEECEDTSIKIWKTCRDEFWGEERCLDDDPPPTVKKE
ncbi:hypothetical protein JW758_00690 [Candidatus Peregrinibacteria bacterium]|nr:hypothetical protein [Candidatus Peregrinibacteria bacterium]